MTENTMMNNLKQRAVESRDSKVELRNMVDTFVDNIEGLDSLGATLDNYIVDIVLSGIEHSIFHAELLQSIRKSDEQVARVAMKIIINGHLDAKESYMDKDVIARKIGMKVTPKTAELEGELFKLAEYHSLTIGLNLTQWLVTQGILTADWFLNKDKHNIQTVELNKALTDSLDEVVAFSNIIRAGKPMMVKPKSHSADEEGGFLNDSVTVLKGKTINYETVQSGVCLDSINIQQEIAYKLCEELPLIEDYKSEEKWYNDKGRFMDKEWNKFIDDMQHAHSNGEFYAPLVYDFRGRMYDRLTYLSIQGDKFSKAYYEFKESEVLTDEGIKYLKIAIVNEVHGDKISFDEALAWFDTNIDTLVPESALAIQLVSAYKRGTQGIAVGTIVHYDATNSGMQWYSVLGRDKVGAEICNVALGEVIGDAYKTLAEVLNNMTETDIFNRKNVKKAFMTYLYGAGKRMIMELLEDNKQTDYVQGLYTLFPKDVSIDDAWVTFEDAMRMVAPAAVDMMDLIYRYVSNDDVVYEWTMPDGFKVHYSPTSVDTIKGHFVDLDKGTTRQGSIDGKKIGKMYDKSMAPNIIHAVDSYFLREVVRRCGFKVSTIHDSFGVHPNNAGKLMEVVRDVTAEILEMNLLENILGQLNERLTSRYISKQKFTKGELTVEDIYESKYILR